MTEQLITIGITCYREGEWLLECWESLLAQTDDRWEAILVMDGGADERTRKIFSTLDHPKLRKIALTDNIGCHQAHNKAFEMTTTPYHFYLDGDDKLVPESISLILKGFSEHPDAGFIYGDYEVFGGVNTDIIHWPIDPLPEDVPDNQPPGGCAYKKAVWQQLGGYSREFPNGAGDWDFHLTMAEAGVRGYHCRNVFYRYRKNHVGRLSSSYKNQMVEKYELMVRRHPRLFADSRRRKRFLAKGNRVAAYTYYWSGDLKVASELVIRGMHSGNWKQRYLWVILLAPYLPKLLANWLRQYWQKRIE